jgi:2-polyprenyl-6-methoxyphenol hydroxylase-like FAD-dependent oxidoreductase
MSNHCCIVGGGPAGMMLGLLLARAGVRVTVLEKHADFFRDFRGDTIHPSTLEVIHELGLLPAFLQRPHQEVKQLRGWVGDTQLTIADFTHLPTQCKFIAFMPQWDFLDFIAGEAKRYSNFELRMQAEVVDLIEENDRVMGVRVKTSSGLSDVRADLVVGADGRQSVVREKAGLSIKRLGVPFDVFWLRLSRHASDPDQTLGRFDRGRALAMLNRGDYWQCGYVIPKDSAEKLRREGLDTFRSHIAEVAPFLSDRVGELKTWDDAKLLTVRVDRLSRWYKSGLLCIGDAAHAMSPVGGVGINLAIQDAVAAANRLAGPLKQGTYSLKDLKAVQSRRAFPTHLTQRLQLFIQNNVIRSALEGGKITTLPWPLKLFRTFPILQRLPARLVGIGFRPEHVHSRRV